jgi:ATP-binding cassette subfamily E protein 1
VPTENLRFREESLVFKVAESATEEEVKRMTLYEYPAMKKNLGDFKLEVCRGQFTDSEILVLLGENGTGKTTFIKMLAGVLQPDDGSGELPRLNISYKPQKISPKSQCQVRQLLHDKIRDAYTHPQASINEIVPFGMDRVIRDNELSITVAKVSKIYPIGNLFP